MVLTGKPVFLDLRHRKAATILISKHVEFPTHTLGHEARASKDAACTRLAQAMKGNDGGLLLLWCVLEAIARMKDCEIVYKLYIALLEV